MTGSLLVGCHTDAGTGGKTEVPVQVSVYYESESAVGIARGPASVVELKRGPSQTGGRSLTRDGRYVYAVGTSTITAVDTDTLQQSEIDCPASCLGYLPPLAPLQGSIIGGFDLAAPENQIENGLTTTAIVHGIDLSSQVHGPRKLGSIPLGSAHPAQTGVMPYTYFLSASERGYAFLDAVDYRPTRPWELPQTLYLVRPDGTKVDLGRYAFPGEDSVWGAFSVSGDRLVIGSFDVGDEETSAPPASCPSTGVDVIDVDSGQKSTTYPADGDPNVQFRVGRAWWDSGNALYASFQRRECGDPSWSAPQVWKHADGKWVMVRTPGPANFALDLGDQRMAVVEPEAPQPSGGGETYDITKGTLYYVERTGARTRIARDVTAIGEVRPK